MAQILAWTLGGMILTHAVLLLGYLIFLNRSRRALHGGDECAGGECGRAAVILCVRGLDPFLPACLKGLFHQEYPDYDVWVVVDSHRDPAWPVVNKLAKQSGKGNIHVLTLTERLATSSRKIAGMLQAMSQLDGSYEIVALLDSDTIPHSSWLSELAAPLADPRVGISSGNRWYMPATATAGSLVRYLWNAAAIVQMYWYGIGWGGSLAIRGEFLRRSDLLERLARAFGEDSTICRCALAHGYRIAFSPTLAMVNRETCNLKGVFGFLERQMLTVRLHNPWWWAVLAHGAGTTAALALSTLTLGAALATGNGLAAAWVGAALAAYWASLVLMIVPLERFVRRIVRSRDEPVRGLGLGGWLRAIAIIPLAQAVHFTAMTAAVVARTHRWRGVRYRFGGLTPVRVIEDRAEAA